MTALRNKTMKQICFFIICLGSVGSAKAGDPAWSVSPAAFDYSMTVTAVLEVDCIELTNPSNRLGAFVGADVRGSVLSSTMVGGRYIALLTVYSNSVSGESIEFKIYNADDDVITDAVTVVEFQDDGSYGTPSSPQLITDNHVPTDLSLSSNSIEENNEVGDAIGNLSILDIDVSDTHDYTLVAGDGDTDNGSFSISATELRIEVVADEDTQTEYSVRIRGEDSGGCGIEQIFTIMVLPVNEPPTDIFLSVLEVNEGNSPPTEIGTFSSEDDDVNESFTYELVAGAGDTDNASFMPDGDKLFAVSGFDFETQSSYSIRVRSTDVASGTLEKEFAITILDINEPPYDLTLDINEVVENQDVGTVIGLFSASDDDAGDIVTFTLADATESNDNESFTVNGSELLTNSSFNFEETSEYFIDVIGTDLDGEMVEMPFSILITDANDTPVNLSLSNTSYIEDQPSGSEIGTFTVEDEDSGDTHTYTLDNSIPENDNSFFAIDGNRLLSASVLDFDIKALYSISVIAEDNAGATTSAQFEIDVDEISDINFPSIDLVTPNGDGINDTWVIQDVETFANYTVRILDASGKTVFQKNSGYQNEWDGGSLPSGAYFYIVSSNTNNSKEFTGTISLIQ